MSDDDEDNGETTELPDGLGEPQGTQFEKDHNPEEDDDE